MKINILNKKSPTNLNELKNILLSNRDLKTKKEIEEFLEPINPEKLTYKEVGIDTKEMKKAIKLIKKYKNKKIVIYSDYDADGVCSGAILWQALYSIGADAVPFIPSREEDGYGLSKSGIDKILDLYPNQKILIITVDNGIVANEAAEYLKSIKNLQLIITDHHVKGKTLPTADCILHTVNLCGAGVAWIFSKEIFKNFKIEKNYPEYQDTLDILTIATVADMVPLTKFNRAIVKHGFSKLKNTRRAGIVEIFQEAQIKPENINSHTIGFVIAPRLNAMGRLTHALSSLRLLCTRDPKKAQKLAHELGMTNQERQNLTFEQTEMANSSILKKYGKITQAKILITADSTYNQGVIGLIAGRLMERYHRPAVVIAIGEKISKASTRSIKGFNIIEHLREVEEILINCGGHPMAAGFTIETANIEIFKERFLKVSEKTLSEEVLAKKIDAECNLNSNLISEETFKLIQVFSPFGIANPEPVFLTENVEIQGIHLIGADQKHLKLVAKIDGATFDAIGFYLSQKYANLQAGQNVSLIYSLLENSFNGKTSLQMKIKEIVV